MCRVSNLEWCRQQGCQKAVWARELCEFLTSESQPPGAVSSLGPCPLGEKDTHPGKRQNDVAKPEPTRQPTAVLGYHSAEVFL